MCAPLNDEHGEVPKLWGVLVEAFGQEANDISIPAFFEGRLRSMYLPPSADGFVMEIFTGIGLQGDQAHVELHKNGKPALTGPPDWETADWNGDQAMRFVHSADDVRVARAEVDKWITSRA